MALYITNIAAMRAQNSLASVTQMANTAIQRLTTGFRINSAKDDPAGLQISDRLTAEINGLNQANRNAADGQALAQTIEGALDETVNILQSIRTRAVQAATGTLTQEDREAIQAEVSQLSEEITRIAEQTKYGGKTILNGYDNGNSIYNADGKMVLQIGAYTGNTIEFDMSESFTMEGLTDQVEAKIQAEGGTYTSVLNAEGAFDVSTQDGAQAVLDQIDTYLSVANRKRSELGAVQVRLDSVMRVNANTSVNLADARSRIRDTDYAAESANLMKANILQQAALSMLIQANQRQSMILSLINSVM